LHEIDKENVGRGEIIFIGAEHSAKSSLSRRAHFHDKEKDCKKKEKLQEKILFYT
jgi:hypothetical protein